jgi:hypothetical protein
MSTIINVAKAMPFGRPVLCSEIPDRAKRIGLRVGTEREVRAIVVMLSKYSFVKGQRVKIYPRSTDRDWTRTAPIEDIEVWVNKRMEEEKKRG